MMQQPQFKRFVHRFTIQWMDLENMDDMAPDPTRYKNYYQKNMRELYQTQNIPLHGVFTQRKSTDF